MIKDNRGLSLVEMIIAITVALVIMLTSLAFISSAIKSYNNSKAVIELQEQAQVLSEQIETWIMEGNCVKTGRDDTVLVIYDQPRDTKTSSTGSSLHRPANYVANYDPDCETTVRVIWISDNNNGRIFMKKFTESEVKTFISSDGEGDRTDIMDSTNFSKTNLNNKYGKDKLECCIGQYINALNGANGFNVVVNENATKNSTIYTVNYKIDTISGIHKYSVSNTAYLRNESLN